MPARSVTLIDTDQALSTHLVRELNRIGFQAEAVTDANEVMARKDNLPDLIVLCIDPKKTGWAVCNRLRKSNTLKATPLIITSAEATEKDFEDHKKLKTRAEEYLHKPFGPEALVEKIAGLIGLPQPAESVSSELEIPIDSDDLSIEEEGLVVEDGIASDSMFDPDPVQADPGGFEDAEERTRIGMQIDDQVNLETDAAFAAIGAQVDGAEPTTGVMAQPTAPPQTLDAPAEDDPFALPELSEETPHVPQPLPAVEPLPMAAKSPSVDLDLGLDAVAAQAAPPVRPRRQSSPAVFGAPVSSAPAPLPPGKPDAFEQTTASMPPGKMIEELRREVDRLTKELEDHRNRPAPKAEPSAAAAGFSREREFLNLREIINKKEKEILDLRDSLDGKERQILDGKDKLRELERRTREFDDKLLAMERELVAAREKVEALTHDKERVVEREKQVKGRLDDALKSIARYEEEIESWKKKHAGDVAAVEQSYNQAVAQHAAAQQAMREQHTAQLAETREEHAAQLRELVDQHEQDKTGLVDQHAQDRGRMEAEHARAIAQLRESSANERDAMRVRHESQVADLAQQHDQAVRGLKETHATAQAQLIADHDAAQREKDQLHADEVNGLRARHSNDTKAAERRHADEMAQLAEGHKRELAAADERRQQELAARADDHRKELEGVLSQHLKDKAQLERDHDAAVAALDAQRQNELKAQAEAHLGELARTSSEMEAKHAEELKGLRDSHTRKLQALEESHADLKAGMQQRHTQQVDELKNTHAAAVAEYDAAIKQRDGLITEGHERMAELDAAVAQHREDIERQAKRINDLDAKLQVAVAEIGDRENKLSERAQRVAELEQESAGYQDQILKAYQRIKSDESIVSRAKKALAIALTLLDESAPEGGDEAST